MKPHLSVFLVIARSHKSIAKKKFFRSSRIRGPIPRTLSTNILRSLVHPNKQNDAKKQQDEKMMMMMILLNKLLEDTNK